MLVTALKHQLERLPGEDFNAAMTCIEALNSALDAAGPAAIVALEYVRLKRQEALVLANRDLQHTLAMLKTESAALADAHLSALGNISGLKQQVASLRASNKDLRAKKKKTK